MNEDDPGVTFITSGGTEQVETLLERVRGTIEKAFTESPSMQSNLIENSNI